jgi:hypothetical protein
MSNPNIKDRAIKALDYAATELGKLPGLAIDKAKKIGVSATTTAKNVAESGFNSAKSVAENGTEIVKESVKKYEDYAQTFDVHELKRPAIYAFFLIIMFILICCVLKLIYSKSTSLPPEKGIILSQQENYTITLIVVFTIAIAIIALLAIPNYKDLLIFFSRFNNVYLLILYIIALIILYRTIPRPIIDNYALAFLPLTMLIGIYLFYLAIEKNKIYGFNINYERVKYIIIYFCLIVFMLLLYTVDPGGYLKAYFGPSLIISILIGVFGFLYLLTLMNLPGITGKEKGVDGLPGTTSSFGGLFQGLTMMGLLSGISFILFLTVIVSGILAYSGGFLNGSSNNGLKVNISVIVLLSFFTILSGFFAYRSNFFKEMSNMKVFSVIAFVICFISIMFGVLGSPGGFFDTSSSHDKTNKVSGIIILLVMIFVAWIFFFGILFFNNKSGGNESESDSSLSYILNLARQIFMLLFGLIISGLLIGWLVTGVESLSSKSGIIAFILNLLIVIAILTLVFKLVTGGTFYRKYAIFRLIVNSLLYIPCIFLGVIETILAILGFGATVGKSGLSGLWSGLSTTIEATKNTPTSYYLLLAIIILIYIFYFFLADQIKTNISKQGGTLIVNNPVQTNIENVIGYYDDLNGTKTQEATNEFDHNYAYAISFWLFIDADSPNYDKSLNKYTSILNYGDKPSILYNSSENTMIFTLKNDGEPAIGSKSRMKKPPELDASGNIILYKMTDILLQKWNNIIINYSNGTLDIFYNGELVKSVNEAVPKMSKDALIIGSNKGVSGGICNLVYFNTHIDASQVYYLYNSVKDKTPPVPKKSKESIIKTVMKATNIKGSPPVIEIPIKIDVTAKTPELEEKPVLFKPVKSDPSVIKMDYLSFDWFTNQG